MTSEHGSGSRFEASEGPKRGSWQANRWQAFAGLGMNLVVFHMHFFKSTKPSLRKRMTSQRQGVWRSNMRSKLNRVQHHENDRQAREQHNQQQSFLTLPAEIRNRIYQTYLSMISASLFLLDHSMIRLTDDFTDFDKLIRPEKFPPPLQICRQTRTEFLPMFFSKVTATLHLESLIGRSNKPHENRPSFLDVLCARSLASLGKVGIHSTARCFRSDIALRANYAHNGVWAHVGGVYIVLDRVAGQGRIGRHTTHKDISNKAVEELIDLIKSMRLHQMDHELCKDDFKKLARQFNWSKSRKRVWNVLRGDAL